jgi:bacteriocin biosynthesis cyclodehydratase domain-containing protein
MSRLVLAPGLRVLRRSRTILQVGLTPPRRVLLPDSEPVRRTLAALVRGETPPDDPEADEVIAILAPVLVDGAKLVVPDVADEDVAAAALLDPSGYPDRLAARRGTTIAVSGALGAVDPRPLLDAVGLGVCDAATDGATPTVALVLRVGEVDRDDLDPWVRAGLAHLVVRLVEGTAVVGPFVEPGRTACLRCLDAHAAEDDPFHAVVTAGRARAGSRSDGVAEPVDTALTTLAVAWAVRDLVTYVEGERPSTWSTTVQLSAALSAVTQAEWLRHPACGCNWLPD